MAKTNRVPDEEPVPEGDNKGKSKAKSVHIEDDVNAALEAFRASQKWNPTRKNVINDALKDFLEKEGFWPWPRKE